MGFVKVIRKDEQKVSTWSGGTTTELYIYPQDAIYNERNFMFRISSAKVELEESSFTHLPNIDRKIMVLDGELRLIHENHYEKYLKKFEKDSFKGDWSTRSIGKVTDFNLMTNCNCDGDIEYIKIDKNSSKILDYSDIKSKYEKVVYALYCLEGCIDVKLEEDISLNSGDIVVIFKDAYENEDIKVINNLEKEADIILSKIYIIEKFTSI
ncbi:MAG: HutD/Ves family protein [Paraclostridium sp.]